MNDNTAPLYDLREDATGWTVFVVATGEAARVNGVPQTGLDVQDADELVELLTMLEEQKAGKPRN